MIYMEVAILLTLIFCAIATVSTRNLLSSIIVFMSFSSVMAIVWLLLEAPDLAITEAAVGVGVDTILFVLTLKRIRSLEGTEKDET